MSLSPPITREKLKQAFEELRERAWQEYGWYEKRVGKHRVFSIGSTVITFFLLTLGITLPLAEKNSISFLWVSFDSPIYLGHACLLLASIFLALDQVFLFSKTWRRYVTAMRAIKSSIYKLEYEWHKFYSGLINDSSAQENRESAIELLAKFSEEIQSVVVKETTTWSNQLEEARAELKRLVNEQKTIIEKQVVKDQEDRKRLLSQPSQDSLKGGVIVEIINTTKVEKAHIEINIEGLKEERISPVNKITFPNISIGRRKVKLIAAAPGGNVIQNEDLIEIKKDVITTITFDISDLKD